MAGDGAAALKALMQGALVAPDAEPIMRPLARRLADMRFRDASPAVMKVMELALASPWVDPQSLAPSALFLLDDQFGFEASMTDPLASDLAAAPLLARLLEQALLPSAGLEAWLIETRRRLLDAGAAERLPLASALAAQALLNGWMWQETEAETLAVEALGLELSTATAFGPDHILYAVYRPLADLEGAMAAAERAKGPYREPARVLALEPAEERRRAERLPTLTELDDPASVAVKAQYEAFPYPRWARSPSRRPRPIRAVAEALFPAAELPDWPERRLDVLIAGCGTGKHAADVASRFQGASVLAIDLSRAALGFGARKLKHAGNVRFAEADIMALGQMRERFDHIESVGVLHHLADPFAGWSKLVELLRPGGSMRLGFYSARGRRRIQRAREAMAAAGFHGRDDQDLRAARAHALAAPKDAAEKLAVGELDFFAASGARDFLFHAQETEYGPAVLADMADRLGLRILGLEFVDAAGVAAYRKKFPDDPAMADLRRWDAIEAEAPDTFRHMCQFWATRA